MLPKSVNITAKTGVRVAGPPVSWQTRNGPFNVEHVAAVTPDDHLVAFWWSPQHDWQSVDISAITKQRATGGVAAWRTRNGPFLVEHLAARNAAGELIAFRWSPQHDWQAVNISAKTGRRIAGAPVAWQTTNGANTVEHLAARGPNNELLAFWWSPAHDWQVVDITAKTGRSVSHDPTAWQSRNGPMVVEHLAAASPGGALSVFWWSPAHDWQALDVSHIAGGNAAGAAVSWLTDAVEHVAVPGKGGALFVYWWTPASNWRCVDVAAITGQPIAELGAAYQRAETGQNVELLIGRAPDNSVLRYWWRPDRDWQAQNLAQATGVASAVAPCAWQTPNGVAVIEHVAAVTPDHALVAIYDDGESRRLTDAAGEPPQPMKRLAGRTKVVALLWDPHRPTDPAPPVAAIDDKLFGPANSVRDYYLQVSGNAFTVERAGVLGWFDASRPASYWWGPPDTNDADHDGWVNPHNQKWAEAVRFADPQFNFKAFDTSAADGTLRANELSVLIVIPQNSPFGTNRGALGREYPSAMPLVVDGVTIPTIAEWYAGSPPNLGAVAHELGHLIANLPDLYFALPHDPMNDKWKDPVTGQAIPFDNPFAAADFCLMDNTYNNAHFCPFIKMKLGWLRPHLVLRSGHYQLRAIEQEREVWILMHPSRGTREYFIVENRFPTGNYDANLPDRGLGVWHIIEDAGIYGAHIPPVPPNPPAASHQERWAEKWGLIGTNEWGRRGIRMIRPVWDTLRRGQSLWDGSDPVTGYDLLPDAPPPHASLRWADGSPSGFAVRNISPAGQTMAADITVPW